MSSAATSPAETTLLEQAGVLVTNARFVSGAETYAMRNITSVSSSKQPPKRKALIITGLVGLLACPINLFVGVPLVAGAGFLLWKAKPTYHVVLRTSGGEANALKSPDEALIQRVVSALNQAIVMRG